MDNFILDEGFQNNQEAPELTFASQGKRVINYFVDIICAYLCIFLVATFFIALKAPEDSLSLIHESRSDSILSGWESIFTLIAFSMYYFLTEFFLKGRTLGKFLTGTRAITTQHEYLTAGDALKRTLCRLVPFDALSFLFSSGYGWHDKWTDTMVVEERDFRAAYI